MKNMKKVAKTVGTLGLVGCAVMSSSFAVADDEFWYMGGNIGQARAKIDDARITSQLQSAGLATSSINNDSKNDAYKLFGGYQFSKNFALEGGYFNLGEFGYMATTVPAGTQIGKIDLQGLNLDAVGTLPLVDKFSVFARLGLQYAQAKDSFSSTGAAPTAPNLSPSKNALNYKAGLGVQYDFTRALGMRLEAERYRINDAVGNTGDINMYSVGLVYRFNEKEPAPVQKEAPPPAEVAVVPYVVVVPIVKTQKYCSVLDIQFDIKQQGVQVEDKEKLKVLGIYMKKYPDTTAIIEGHSDNVGKSDYNMKLSQQRADSVVSYLVNEIGIAPSRLTAVGYGETRPIADNSTNEGREANRRIDAVIACVTDIANLKVVPARITMAMEIQYGPYKTDIEPQYREGLNQVADYMKANPSVNAVVEAYADSSVGVGSAREPVSADEAMDVSDKRAKNVVNYLADQGVARSRLATASFGKTGRTSYGTTLAGQQENRRVNIIINYAK